jgi:peptidyl-prolyl cis-trans isomerase C
MISVNGVIIEEEAVGRELQFHPGGSREDVAHKAATALVVRELLAQRAGELGLDCTDDEALDLLVAREVEVPEPSEAEIERFYRTNWLRLRTPPLYEAAHIFFPARPDDDAAREEAKERAKLVLRDVLAEPRRFAEFARAHSKCASAEAGGALGQVSRGDTNPEVERFLATMEPGTICATPVPSRHGYHILRLDRRDAGRELPLEQVRDKIADYLREKVRRRAIAQYLQLLAGRATIEGIDLGAADSPLVQ